MKLKLGKSIHTFHNTILLMLLVSIILGGYFFWTKGALNSEKIASIYEANLQYDKIKEKKHLKKIEKLVISDRVRDAVQLLDQLKKNAKELNFVQVVDEYQKLTLSLIETNKSLNSLLSYPEIVSIVFILRNKIKNFEKFVTKNNWKTLRRMSQVTREKVTPTIIKNQNSFSYKRLRRLYKRISADVDKMRVITANSVLSNTDKNLISNKLKTFDIELDMLSSYLKDLDLFNKDVKILKKRFDFWLSAIGPEISLKRIKVGKISALLVYSIFGVVIFLILAMAMGQILQGHLFKKSNSEVEDFILKVIKDGLVPFEDKMTLDFSNKFMEQFYKFKRYFHKRISFGSVFQEALPFAGILLDSNLNLLWGNDIFYSSWNIEDRGRDRSISWDYLQRFTNLGENDPIMMALNDGVAGIYQIQVKQVDETSAMPYEMYISPVDYAGEKRIMILFYPLNSLEDTLAHQSKSLVGPVSRTLEALLNESFDSNFKEKIKKDFDIAGINKIYDRFSIYSDKKEEENKKFSSEIKRLNEELFDQYKLLDNFRDLLNKVFEDYEKIVKSFNASKGVIVQNIDLRYEVEGKVELLLGDFKKTLAREDDLIDKSIKIANLLDENINAFDTVSDVRDDFKRVRDHIDDFRGHLVQTVDESLVHLKREGVDSKMNESLSTIKLQVRDFDKTLSQFGDVVRSLDVSLSKIELILFNTKRPEFDSLKKVTSFESQKILVKENEVSELVKLGELRDEKLISNLQLLFDDFQESKNHIQMMFDLADGPMEKSNSVEFPKLRETVRQIDEQRV